MQYLFVITHGRSGSTFLQTVLNSLPGYCIRGENAGMMSSFQTAYERLMDHNVRFGPRATTQEHPWYGIGEASVVDFFRSVRELFVSTLLHPPEDCRVTGFKEIRYGPPTVTDLTGMVFFMRKVFPGARFIFNVRDPHATAKSDWWANMPDALEYLTAFHDSILAAHGVHSDVSTLIRLEEFTAGPEGMERLFEWLGESVGPDRIQTLLANPINATPTVT